METYAELRLAWLTDFHTRAGPLALSASTVIYER